MHAESTACVLPHVPQEGTSRRWFIDGEACLAVDVPERDDARVEALHDAILLGRLDPLLQRIALLCECDFDWQPTSESSPGRLTVSAAADQRIALGLPAALEQRLLAASELGALPAEGGDEPLRFVAHRQCAHLVLDRVLLDQADTARLAPGALLLLPASFEPHWRATLSLDSGDSLPVPVLIDAASGVVRTDPGCAIEPAADAGEQGHKGGPDGDVRTVSLAATIEVSLDRLPSGLELRCDLSQGAAIVMRRSGETPEDAVHEQVGVSGMLIAVGGGHGVRLDTED